MTKDEIRAIFMAHGFTVKEGQTDLKPYVFEAAEALLAAHSAGSQPVMTDLCTLRHRIAAAPRRQFESAPRIYTNWLSQDAVLDLIDAEIERIEREGEA